MTRLMWFSAFVLSGCVLNWPAMSEAAISCSTLTQSTDATSRAGGADVYTTASVSPSANALILLAFQVTRAATDIGTPGGWAASGNGLTWVEIDNQTYSTAGAPSARLFLFRTLGSSPSSGAITVTWAGGWTMSNATWAVVECTGVDTGGTNGSAAVVQSNKNSNTSSTSLTLALSAFASASNATFATFGIRAAGAVTPEGSWTELAEQQQSEAGAEETIEAEWINANDTSPSASWSSADAAGIAIEIQIAASNRRPIAPMVMQ